MSIQLRSKYKDNTSYGGGSVEVRKIGHSSRVSPGNSLCNNKSENSNQRYFMGYDKNSFPMIRDEKEEMFAPKDS